MLTRWEIGDGVRVVRNLRNDGTFPGFDTGNLLVRRGSVGTVVDIGTFLQDQVIYSVHFLEDDRVVGCREEELVDADDAWIPSAFESRERVLAAKILAVGGGGQVPKGAIGEVLRVIPDPVQKSVSYHMHFECLPGRTLAVPESALVSISGAHHV